ncbi:MAG TPA: lipoate--protein ligase [Actinobacteria bacterium]|nr:lipoate--protein ligase [Actinomycetota bacterium]
MHGEYQPHGGKLVAADVEVTGGRLARVQVSGDFVPGAAGALGRIGTAVTGLPVTADTAVITAGIQAALGGGVLPAGICPSAVAVAVRRAVLGASDWRDHDWQLVHEGPQEPALHMAIDEVLLREVAAGRRPATLRIWEWSAPAVVIGSFQSLRNEVDVGQARRLGITVVRRISGGGAMFIEPENTITYSLYAPESLVAGLSFADSYAFLDDWVIAALTGDLGLAAWYQPLNDIASSQGKIGGAAQKRLASAVLHHVTMAYDMDAQKLTRVLRTGREKLSGKGIPSAIKRVDPLRRQTRLTREQVIGAMTGCFRRRHGLTDGGLAPAELRAAGELARAKFTSGEWTARLP